MPSTLWRAVWSGHLPAADNMAVDEALFETVLAGGAPTLRVYGWEPPGVSLGMFQPVDRGVDLAAVARRGYGLVRRPTGGRAIIHHHEVTYSVCIREKDLAGGHSVLQSYKEISRGIELGLRMLGAAACMPEQGAADREKGHDLPTVCFAKVGSGDMVVDGRKIVGSAQMRRGGVILQHGSIPIRIDLEEHLEILGADPSAADREQAALRNATATVADAVGREVSFDELGGAVVAGFMRAFEVEMDEAALTAGEKARAAELVRTKYGAEGWTQTPGRRGG
jgi:lipoyl(octanoyl) transferase